MMQDKYRRLIEIGNILKDRDGMQYEVISISDDGLSMKLREIREDAQVKMYDCNSKASRKLWIVQAGRS